MGPPSGFLSAEIAAPHRDASTKRKPPRPRDVALGQRHAALLRPCSHPITEAFDPFALGAVLAAVKRTRLLQAVPDDARSAMIAGRRERVDGAFEAVERMRLPVHGDLKRLVVVVTAGFAGSHGVTFAM